MKACRDRGLSAEGRRDASTETKTGLQTVGPSRLGGLAPSVFASRPRWTKSQPDPTFDGHDGEQHFRNLQIDAAHRGKFLKRSRILQV